MKTLLEKRYYPGVKGWMQKPFPCFIAEINKGVPGHSTPDIVGVQDVGGDLSGDIETIIVEVKRGNDPFIRACGQTLSYGVYANRVYLADIRTHNFSSEELQVAGHLGIGLVRIRKENKSCAEISSSPFHIPVRSLNLRLLEVLGLGRCQLCDSFFKIGNAKNHWSNVERAEDEACYVVKKALDREKGIMFWRMRVAERKRKLHLTDIKPGDSNERRFICPECVTGILALDVDRVKGWFKEYAKANALSF
jgi:hypothetical protein